MTDNPIFDDVTAGFEAEPDPPEFDRSKVPAGALADYFFDGRTGRGLADAEWDEQRARLREYDADPFGGGS